MDESALLQQFALVAKGYISSGLDIGSEDEHKNGSGRALMLTLAVLSLLAAAIAAVMCFSYFMGSEKNHRRAFSGMQSPLTASIKEPHPQPRTDTYLQQRQQVQQQQQEQHRHYQRGQRSRMMAPRQRTPSGEGSPKMISTAPAVPAAPAGYAAHAAPKPSQKPAPFERPRYTLQVPSLLNMRADSSGVSVHHVHDAAGKAVLNVNLMLLRQEMVEMEGISPLGLSREGSGILPSEYVSIYSSSNDEELALCALGPGEGGKWECNLYRGENELFGYVVEDGKGQAGVFQPEQRYMLIGHPGGERLLTLQGRLEERNAQLLGTDGFQAAVVEPGPAGPVDANYKVMCTGHETFAGLVLPLLLGVDRLRSRHGSKPQSPQ